MTEVEKEVIQAAREWYEVRTRLFSALNEDQKVNWKDPYYDLGSKELGLITAVSKL